LSGYDNDKEHSRNEKMHVLTAETIPGNATDRLSYYAKKYGMYIVFGMPELCEGKVYNYKLTLQMQSFDNQMQSFLLFVMGISKNVA